MQVHQRIRAIAKAQRISIARLARASGVAMGTLHKPRDGVRFEVIERVLDTLGYEILFVPRNANNLLSDSPTPALKANRGNP